MSGFSAVVYTAGRTGSYALIEKLCNHFDAPQFHYGEENITHGIVHTHNPLYKLPTDNFLTIISRRHNTFDAIMSMLIARITDEYHFFTNKEIVPRAANIAEFKNYYLFHKSFYLILEGLNRNNVVDVYYEDMISNPTYLFELFGISGDFTDVNFKKSPYDYNKIFTNVAELKSIFFDLEKNPISKQQLEDFKNSVEADLSKFDLDNKKRWQQKK